MILTEHVTVTTEIKVHSASFDKFRTRDAVHFSAAPLTLVQLIEPSLATAEFALLPVTVTVIFVETLVVGLSPPSGMVVRLRMNVRAPQRLSIYCSVRAISEVA